MAPNTIEDAGLIVGNFIERQTQVIVAGHWSIEAFTAEHPNEESNQWLQKHPPTGPLDLTFRLGDQSVVKSVLQELGYVLQDVSDRNLLFKNAQGDIINVSFFRVARDGGRIYPKLGLNGEDWYYAPHSVAIGRLGTVPVLTEGPLGPKDQREARIEDEN